MLQKLYRRMAIKLGQLTDHVNQLPLREMQRRALMQSCDYIEAKMPDAIGMNDQASCLRHALSKVGSTPGVFMEFGVFQGTSIRIIGDVAGTQRRIYGFDSFEGLPTDWFGYSVTAGHFNMKGRLPEVRPNTTLVKGWFSDTLPQWCDSHPDPVAFLNIDSDLYSSAVTVLTLLKDRIQPGTIIHFDEYLNYPGWQHHEHKAWGEFTTAHHVDFTYLAYSRWGVALRVNSIHAT